MRLAALSILTLAAFFAIPAYAAQVNTKAGNITLDSIAKFENPWAIAVLPDRSLLITEKPGRLRKVTNEKVSEPIKGVPSVAFAGQGGLLGVVADPEFASNGFVYLAYSEPADQPPANAADPGDERRAANSMATASEMSVLFGGRSQKP